MRIMDKLNHNMEIYEACRNVPSEAKKTIGAGRLKGYTDISPMWRIKKLTEMFGVCGFGWKIITTKKWTENGANGEVFAFVDIELFVGIEGSWSDPIEGSGGHKLVINESKGLYSNDEAFKMATTDAISVACKMLGIGADVYWDKDNSKYSNQSEPVKPVESIITEAQLKELFDLSKSKNISDAKFNASLKKSYGLDDKKNLNNKQFEEIKKNLSALEDKK
jgi:hypothetical protein